LVIPESQEQERGNQPFRNPQEPAGTPNAESRVHPRSKRAVADKRDQRLRLVIKPFLIPKEQKDEHHRCANQVVIEISLEETGLGQDLDERVHWLLLCWYRNSAHLWATVYATAGKKSLGSGAEGGLANRPTS